MRAVHFKGGTDTRLPAYSTGTIIGIFCLRVDIAFGVRYILVQYTRRCIGRRIILAGTLGCREDTVLQPVIIVIELAAFGRFRDNRAYSSIFRFENRQIGFVGQGRVDGR